MRIVQRSYRVSRSYQRIKDAEGMTFTEALWKYFTGNQFVTGYKSEEVANSLLQKYKSSAESNESGEEITDRTKEDGLRTDSQGEKIPDPEARDTNHTQLGTRKGRKGEYKQAREFNEKNEPVRDIDFTDHGRPQNHPNPHQHRYKDNITGGTKQRNSIAEPLD